ncbi:MAG TPA: MAPEG family protein [Pseudomonadales bacterium]
MSVPITAIYAGLCGLLAVVLANNVLYFRMRARRQPEWRPEAVLRVQANFVENVPLALTLLLALELCGAAHGVLHAFGAALVVFRLLHAFGMSLFAGANYPRLIGAQGTFLLISAMSVSLVYAGLIA